MAAVEIQDEWTGNYKLYIRKIYCDGSRYYCRCDGQKIDMSDAWRELIHRESDIDCLRKMRDKYERIYK